MAHLNTVEWVLVCNTVFFCLNCALISRNNSRNLSKLISGQKSIIDAINLTNAQIMISDTALRSGIENQSVIMTKLDIIKEHMIVLVTESDLVSYLREKEKNKTAAAELETAV